MKIAIFAALMLGYLTFTNPALADDKPIMAPPAAWVHVAEAPKIGAITDGMAVKVLLSDQQGHLGADGTSIYQETVLRVQTSQGLPALGTLTLAWDPSLDKLVIHKIHILRDGQVIDILGKQTFTILRRESNLEVATLDGVLSAVIQPEDLRVGDTIDMAFTRIRKDPSLGGRQELYWTLPDAQVDDMRLRVTADAGFAFRWRATDALKEISPKTSGEGADVSVAIVNMQPLRSPEHAPARYANVRRLEITTFKSWADLSAIMAPLYDKAEVLQSASPLKAEVDRIKAFSADPSVRAAKALALVQDQIRYVALSMNDGGFVPATADDTWSRRFGDCKGKTVLLIALLRGLGIDAQPALVSSLFGDGIDERLPAIENFDHVMVRAAIGGKTYWLDGTRTGDFDLDAITTPAFFWALPVQDAKAELVRLTPIPLNKPNTVNLLSLDASAGIDSPAPAHAERTFEGDGAVLLNASLANLAPAQMDQALKAYWGEAYDFIKIKSASAHYDPQTREERLVMDGIATMQWEDAGSTSRRYEADGAVVGWKPDFDRQSDQGADAPFAVTFPAYEEIQETIRLPGDGKSFTLDGGDINQKAAGFEFKRKAAIIGNVFSMTVSTRSFEPEFPASEAAASAKILKDLINQGLYIRTLQSYHATAKDLDQLKQTMPETINDFLDRGLILLNSDAAADAAGDFRKAVALDPKSAVALADLGLAEIKLNNLEAANDDFTKAEAADSKNWVVFQGRGDLAVARHQYDAAVQAFTKALELNPEELNTLSKRSALYASRAKWDLALADISTLEKLQPQNAAILEYKARVLSAASHPDKALIEIDKAVAIEPDEAAYHATRGRILIALKRSDEAKGEFDRAISLNPTADVYAARAEQESGKIAYADLKAALKLRPDSSSLQQQVASMAANQGDDPEVIVDLTGYIEKNPGDASLRLRRGEAYLHSHQIDLAEADFIQVRTKLSADADTMHELCNVEGRAAVLLDKALSDCNVALKMRPIQNTYLEGRALVLMRLKRYPEAIAAYDAALHSVSDDPVALYGRGLAKLAGGRDGRTDLALARKADPKVAQTFADMGLIPSA